MKYSLKNVCIPVSIFLFHPLDGRCNFGDSSSPTDLPRSGTCPELTVQPFSFPGFFFASLTKWKSKVVISPIFLEGA